MRRREYHDHGLVSGGEASIVAGPNVEEVNAPGEEEHTHDVDPREVPLRHHQPTRHYL